MLSLRFPEFSLHLLSLRLVGKGTSLLVPHGLDGDLALAAEVCCFDQGRDSEPQALSALPLLVLRHD
jgi:hypothetical protein